MIKVIIFLGNPDSEHKETRHNIGWMLSDASSLLQSVSWNKKFKGLYATINVNDEKVYLLKPETYMNKSGDSIQALLQFFKLSSDEILVVHDELELEFGQISIRKGGGLAGHNGLRSIVDKLQTKEFYRFRLGISRPSHGNVSSYVLSKFSKKEQEELPLYLEKASEILTSSLKDGIAKAIKKHQKTILI